MMTKQRYLKLKQERKELHHELKRYKKFYTNCLRIQNLDRQYVHDLIIKNYNSSRKEYKLITELLQTQQQLLKVTRSSVRQENWNELVQYPF